MFSPGYKNLKNLVDAVRGIVLFQSEITISETIICHDVVQDSRKVTPGSIYVAIRGQKSDGHRFILDAIEHGAVAIVGELEIKDLSVPYLWVADSRQALAYFAAAVHDFPARQLTVIGVTGTDGKTTTVNWLNEILKAAGIQVGMISTVAAVIGEAQFDTGFHVTTPDAPDVQRYLAQMVANGLTHVILETTSHGLAQGRVAACEFDIGIVTNITHEHLDYHGSYAAYRSAKAQLFRYLSETVAKPGGNPRLAVLNRDDDSYSYLAGVVQDDVRVISYGLGRKADLHAADIQPAVNGTHFTALGKGISVELDMRLVGEYNISNSLAACGAAYFGLGVPTEAIQRGVQELRGIPGRMELLDIGAEFFPIVDFAHTPNAMKRALETARQMLVGGSQPGRIIAVFGSAGLRDRLKRRMMAETGQELADTCIFTAEDPRTESLDSILEEMAQGAEARGGCEGVTFFRIPDRGQALRFAVSLAQPGDILIALGKGHEQSMCFGEVEYPWDDRVALSAAVTEYLGIPGPEMPYLPTSAT